MIPIFDASTEFLSPGDGERRGCCSGRTGGEAREGRGGRGGLGGSVTSENLDSEWKPKQKTPWSCGLV